MKQKIRWGILGAGKIVDRWIKGALQVEDMEICAIASRTEETARRAAQRWNIPCVMTYEQMASDDEIDVVYVAVPHTAHKELALLAMQHKKHVLVEKPAAVNAAQFAEMMQCAEENHVFLMEAVWTRFFPLMQEMKTLIRQGTIGDVRCVQASFCFRTADDDHSRLTDPAAAGGSLLDVGVYVLNFADLVYDKEPEKLMGLASINTDACHFQVDEQGAYIARYDRGELAVLQGSIST